MIADVVEKILAWNRAARNSDRELEIEFMMHYGMDLSFEQQRAYKKMPSLSTARRIRRKLQEAGKYQADQKVASERRYKAYRMQQMAPKLQPNKIERIVDTFDH